MKKVSWIQLKCLEVIEGYNVNFVKGTNGIYKVCKGNKSYYVKLGRG